MRILKDFKIPKIKFPKFKIKEVSEIEIAMMNEEELKKNRGIVKRKKNENYEGTNFENIKDVFVNSSKQYSDKTFILEKFGEVWEEITYNKFKNDCVGFGTAIKTNLKLENEKIAIIGENTYHWYVSYMSLLCSDNIAVPIDKELPVNEIINIIKRANISAIIYSGKKKEDIKKVADNLEQVKYFIQMNSEFDLEDRFIGFKTLIDEGKKQVQNGNTSFMNIKVNPDEFKVLLFTSGTTSNSKGVMLTSRNLAQNINAASSYVDLNYNDRLMSILPLHHTYESSIGFLYPYAMGAQVSVCQGLKYIVSDLKETNPTCLLTVPLLVENLYNKINANIRKSKKEAVVNSMIHITNALEVVGVGVGVKRKVFSEIHSNLGGNIRLIVSAAAPIDASIGKWLENIGITFLQGYGLTETAPIAALTPDFKPQIGSAGKAVKDACIKIDNPNEKGEGEILIASKTLMIGYFEDEKATSDVIFEEDGFRWFRSGDIGYLDKDGFLYITGRCKNVIVTQNGKNIYPEELEILLQNIKEIKECMVYGKEEGKTAKELTLCVKVIPDYEYIGENYGTGLKIEQIEKIIFTKIKEINKKVPAYKAIKKLEIKQDEFVKTTTMKIKRFEEIKKN